MKWIVTSLWILTLAATFGLARLTAPERQREDVETLDSFRAALREGDPLVRSYRVSAFFQALGPEALPAAREAFETNQFGVTPEELRLFMLAWTRFDAPAAFAWARGWPTGWGKRLQEEALYAWGFRDGRSARAALEALDGEIDPDLETRLRQSLLQGWIRSPDKLGASETIAGVSDPQRRRRLTFLLAGETMKEGPEAVMHWAEAIPDDAPNDFKQGAFYHASGVVARADPERAAGWYEGHRTRPYSAGALDGIARKWAQHHDPPLLFEWIQGLPPMGERESERSDAIAGGFRIWVGRDAEAAEAWLRAALPDPVLDPAIGELVRALVGSSPASAIAWAGRIEDDTMRHRKTQLAGRRWWLQDPEAASAWLVESGLPDETQQAIRKGPSPMARGRRAVVAPSAGPL